VEAFVAGIVTQSVSCLLRCRAANSYRSVADFTKAICSSVRQVGQNSMLSNITIGAAAAILSIRDPSSRESAQK